MATKRIPTAPFDPTRLTIANTATARKRGPRRRKGLGFMVTVYRVDNVDASASDFVDIKDMGLKGLIDAVFKPDASADACQLAIDTATGLITFTGAATDADGFLEITTAC